MGFCGSTRKGRYSRIGRVARTIQARRAAGGEVQARYKTELSAEDYVSSKAWWHANPPSCPFHPAGGCTLVPHGSYGRKTPAGTRVRRFLCKALEYLRSFGLFGLWQLWQSSGPGGRVHFMIAEKSSDVKVQRVSRLAESKTRCCISHDFGGFYQIIPCIRPAVVQIKVAHGCPATIRIFILGRAVQAWQRESGGRPMPPAMEAKGARSTIRERGNRGQGLSP